MRFRGKKRLLFFLCFVPLSNLNGNDRSFGFSLFFFFTECGCEIKKREGLFTIVNVNIEPIFFLFSHVILLL